jgi:predicted nucleic acid-binding protein
VILADTSVWIDHLRGTDGALRAQLQEARISTHPFVIAELALGNIKDRPRTLAELEMLPNVEVAQLSEVRRMIDVHRLYGKGIGLIDAHLIASTLITAGTQLWTRDKRLRNIAEALEIGSKLI